MNTFKIIAVIFISVGLSALTVAEVDEQEVDEMPNEYNDYQEVRLPIERLLKPEDSWKIAAARLAQRGENSPRFENLIPEGHQVKKRRYKYQCCSRYGFWVTAINKMDNNHLRGFLSRHKNVYNIYKRDSGRINYPISSNDL